MLAWLLSKTIIPHHLCHYFRPPRWPQVCQLLLATTAHHRESPESPQQFPLPLPLPAPPLSTWGSYDFSHCVLHAPSFVYFSSCVHGNSSNQHTFILMIWRSPRAPQTTAANPTNSHIVSYGISPMPMLHGLPPEIEVNRFFPYQITLLLF